jgi:hypothetical protein
MQQLDTKCMPIRVNCHRTPDACVHANPALSSKDSVQNEHMSTHATSIRQEEIGVNCQNQT